MWIPIRKYSPYMRNLGFDSHSCVRECENNNDNKIKVALLSNHFLHNSRACLDVVTSGQYFYYKISSLISITSYIPSDMR